LKGERGEILLVPFISVFGRITRFFENTFWDLSGCLTIISSRLRNKTAYFHLPRRRGAGKLKTVSTAHEMSDIFKGTATKEAMNE